MSKAWYGNLMNRLEEGKQYSPIEVGTDITMYYWSDRRCYYVTEVIDQKHIKVQKYKVVADQSKDLGMGHQDWVYFKTTKEANDYLNSFGLCGYPNDIQDQEEEWVYRYNKWMRVHRFTEENHCSDREKKSLAAKGYYNRYSDLSGSVSFGVRNHYHDWEF